MDNVAVLHDAFQTQFVKLEENFEFYFNLLYAVYSLPNIILPFIGGIMITKLGARLMFIYYGIFIVLGQMVFALGVQNSNMQIMLVGRLIMGFGGECIGICLNAIIVKWFLKSEIALPLGMTISIGRMGSVMNANITPKLASVFFV